MKMITVFCAMNVVVFGTTIQIPTDYTTIQEGIDASLTTAHLYLCQKNLSKEYDKNELNNFIKNFNVYHPDNH